MTLEWKDPPPDTKGRPPTSHWYAIADELRANPGQWALLGNIDSNTSFRIKSGKLAAFRPAGHFEAVTRGVNAHKADVYARYIGACTA